MLDQADFVYGTCKYAQFVWYRNLGPFLRYSRTSGHICENKIALFYRKQSIIPEKHASALLNNFKMVANFETKEIEHVQHSHANKRLFRYSARTNWIVTIKK